MAMEINVKIIKKEIIRPSSPTPLHLKNFELSLLDQVAPVCYGSLLFFYSIDGHIKNQPPAKCIKQLKQSLSETLIKFYPLAGRISKDGASIECNDDGVVFVEAKVNCLLSLFLEKPDSEIIKKLIPVEIDSSEARFGSLLNFQISCFECGGLAIGVCISQKISDAVTAMSFIKEWADISSGNRSNKEASFPLFKAASIFPPQNFSITKPASRLKEELYVTKRFVFDGFNIAALQARAASESVKHPTRVEAVTGLIWKCAVNSSRSNTDHYKLSILSQSANIRGGIVPPVPDQSVGHLAGYFASQATESDQIELASLVAQLRSGMINFDTTYVKKLQEEDSSVAISESFREAGCMLEKGNIDFYISTSLCRFPFYGIDFGWGRPEWFTVPSGVFKNVMVMVDTRDGNGIEAWVTLTEEDMAFFENDKELLAVASLNPSVLLSNPINPAKSSL